MRIGLRLGALASALTLAACSSIPMGTASKLRGLDYLNDDVASLLIALDLPQSLEPLPDGSTLTFDARSPSGERHIKATLVPADAGELAGTLPPPADNRNYYLFGFSDADQQAIREAQAWARTLPPGAGNLSISLDPGLCRTGALDPARTMVSALIALPGATGLAPFLSNIPLSTASAGKDVPACAGHSG